MSYTSEKLTNNPVVHLTADTSHFSSGDQKALCLLNKAVELVNEVFLIQMNQNLKETDGKFQKTRGNNFYPEGMSQEDIESYLDEHPNEREEILSPFTTVQREGDVLRAVPYTQFYQDSFEQISVLLDEAATYVEDEAFKTFLKSRAHAFRTNEYLESDKNWVRVNDAPLELIIGPYENYEDHLFGFKRDVEGLLGVVLPAETAEARVYQKEICAFDEYLGEAFGYIASTKVTPMCVVDEVKAGGSPLYDYVPMACNLPNETEIKKEVGSKQVFFHNVIEAKANLISKKIAQRVLDADAADRFDPAIFLKFILGHESAHGLSFRFTSEDFGTLSSALEEAKADIFGLIFLYFLAERGVIASEVAESAVIIHLADGLRQVRFGVEGEAHARGMVVQYNWLIDQGVMSCHKGKIKFAPEVFRTGLESLGKTFYNLSQTKNKEATTVFLAQWGVVSEEIQALTQKLEGIPIDITPRFTL